jgi:SAM-dependent methyltransferase
VPKEREVHHMPGSEQSVLLAELYDLDVGAFDRDLLLYQELAERTGGPVLELGCGTGRAVIALARAGHTVWGIDNSSEMLERARFRSREAGAQVELYPGDMRDFALDERFGLIFAGYGAFHHLLSAEDQRACLRCVERHLLEEGLFVCDLRPLLFADWADWQSADAQPLFHDWTRQHPTTGEIVQKFRSVAADPASQIQHETHIYDVIDAAGTPHRVVWETDLRFTGRYEMEALLTEAGLHLEGVYGDYDLAPFDGSNDTMIFVSRKAQT